MNALFLTSIMAVVLGFTGMFVAERRGADWAFFIFRRLTLWSMVSIAACVGIIAFCDTVHGFAVSVALQ